MSCTLVTYRLAGEALACVEVTCDAEGCEEMIRAENASTYGLGRLRAARERWRHVLLKRRHGGPAHSIDLCRAHRGLEVESMPMPTSPLWLARRRTG